MNQNFVQMVAVVKSQENNKEYIQKIHFIADINKDINKQVELKAKQHCEMFGTNFLNIVEIKEFKNEN